MQSEQKVEKLLLVVEDSFQISNIGLVLAPFPSREILKEFKSGDIAQVQLQRPDGTSEIVAATFDLQHFNPGGFHPVWVLREADKSQVPPATRVVLLEGA